MNSGVSSTDDSVASPMAIAPPKSKRPQSSNPRRQRMMQSEGSMSSTRISTTESFFEAFAPIAPRASVCKSELVVVAQAERWHLAWPREDTTPQALPSGVEVVVVVHSRGREEATKALVQSLRQAGGLGVPTFVLLFDICGVTHEDFDAALALQQEFLHAGAEEVLCNASTAQELRLVVAMAMRRRVTKLGVLSRMRADFEREVERLMADKERELEEVQATGLFWQSVHRLFNTIPAMDTHLPERLQIGTKVGPCTLDSRLGHGNYGEVFSATNSERGTREAIKIITKGSIKQCKHATALYREVEMHRRLDHEHVVKFLGVMHGAMHMFIRMEEASEANLFKVLSTSGPLAMGCANRFQAQVSQAIAYCHSQGVAHRDVKPENIALDASGRGLKLLDFGCSVQVGTPRMDIAGSFPYMAPEVLLAGATSPYEAAGADVWSCAVTLVDMLCGVAHFARFLGWERGKRVSPKRSAELAKHFGDELAVQRLLAPGLGDDESSGLEELLRGMFDIAPATRWSARRVAESAWLRSHEE